MATPTVTVAARISAAAAQNIRHRAETNGVTTSRELRHIIEAAITDNDSDPTVEHESAS